MLLLLLVVLLLSLLKKIRGKRNCNSIACRLGFLKCCYSTVQLPKFLSAVSLVKALKQRDPSGLSVLLFFTCSKMADAVSFNNVPPPSGNPVDPTSAFADALKRAKEVRLLLRGCKCSSEPV